MNPCGPWQRHGAGHFVPFHVATVLFVFGGAKTEGRPNARSKPKFDGCPWPEANDKMQMDTVNIATGIPQHNQRVVLFTMSAEQYCPKKMAPKFHEQMFPVCLGQLIQNCLLCLGAVAISPLGVMPPLMLFAASLAPVCLPLLLREASRFWLLLQLLWLCALASGLAFCLAFWIANVLQGELDALAVFALIFVAINLLLCLLWIQRLLKLLMPFNQWRTSVFIQRRAAIQPVMCAF